MSTFGHEVPANRGSFRAGLLRLALAAVVALFLARTQLPPGTAYLAVGLAFAFGILLVAGKPENLVRDPLPRVVVDSLLVCLLTYATGGSASPFFPLYLLAALGIAGVARPARIAAAGAVVVAAFLLSSVGSGGVAALLSVPVGLKAALVVAFCAVAGALGSGIGDLAGRNRGLSEALAAGQESLARAEGLISGFGPALRNSSLEEILLWTVGAAHAAGGGTYAHVVLDGTHHRTILDGDPDVCPSWWHPSVQRLVLQSSREGDAVRSGERIHGIEGFLAVPVGPAGAVIVGGGAFGENEERLLRLISGAAASALEDIEDAPGGRDPVTGLPNRASLLRVLRRERSRGRALTVLAVDVGEARSQEVLRKIGEKFAGLYRTFRHGEDEFVVVLGGTNEVRAHRAVLAVRQVVSEKTAVGFAFSETGRKSPEAVLGAALGALAEARGDREGGGPSGEAVRSLVGALEAKDPDIRGHLEDVRSLALRIGRGLSLAEGQLEVLAAGALLHDVGKIGVPDQILHKPGRLTEEEYETLKRHPVLGAEIVAPIKELAPALPIVRHHHERFDGNGYPDGLRGEDIPLTARIVAVADAFDSMIRDRPYGYGVAREAALEEIEANSGTQFDPRVVDALLKLAGEPDKDDSDGRSAGSAI